MELHLLILQSGSWSRVDPYFHVWFHSLLTREQHWACTISCIVVIEINDPMLCIHVVELVLDSQSKGMRRMRSARFKEIVTIEQKRYTLCRKTIVQRTKSHRCEPGEYRLRRPADFLRAGRLVDPRP